MFGFVKFNYDEIRNVDMFKLFALICLAFVKFGILILLVLYMWFYFLIFTFGASICARACACVCVRACRVVCTHCY